MSEHDMIKAAEEATALTGTPITATDIHRIATALEDHSINAPLPHRTPILERINHHWRNH